MKNGEPGGPDSPFWEVYSVRLAGGPEVQVRRVCCDLCGDHIHVGAVVTLGHEFHGTMSGREEGVIHAHADIVAREELGTALAHDNIARDHGFATELLNAKATTR